MSNSSFNTYHCFCRNFTWQLHEVHATNISRDKT